jgi:LmbE family N-acetylglucosaminyl deacetylase
MESKEFTPLTPKVVLGVAAHPDDLDFGAAGTMAKFAAAGAQVHYLILTDGSKGSSDMDTTSEELIKVRQQEQRSAVAAVGGAGVEFLGHPDGMLEITMDLKREIVKAIRTIQPDVIVTMDPGMLYSSSRGFINHPDHRAAGQATLDAVFPLARDHLSFPELLAEGFAPHNVVDLLFMSFSEATMVVDISDTYDIKLKALAAHASQVNLEDVSGWLDSSSRMTGQPAGYERGEGFIRLNMFL